MTLQLHAPRGKADPRRTLLASACAALVLAGLTLPLVAQARHGRTFPTPEAAVQALIDTVKAGDLEGVIAIFGPDGRELAASSDPVTGMQNRELFTVAVREKWHLVDAGANRKTLVIGNEEWPFPVPLAKASGSWHFDTAAGKEEVLARRIGRNELAAIDTCRAYVTAQRRYASQGHDGKPVGVYAASLRSDPGKENGLYWPTAKGQHRSPLGDLVAQAAEEGRPLPTGSEPPAPLHGYYFKVLTEQGAAAPGGARKYVVDGGMTGGFALVAWPAEYDVTGVMTFIVSQDGVVREKDLGKETDAAARRITAYNPDPSWHPVQ